MNCSCDEKNLFNFGCKCGAFIIEQLNNKESHYILISASEKNLVQGDIVKIEGLTQVWEFLENKFVKVISISSNGALVNSSGIIPDCLDYIIDFTNLKKVIIGGDRFRLSDTY